MPSVIPDYVNKAKDSLVSAGNAMQQYAGREYTIGDELKKVLNDATTEGKTDWANIRSTTLSDYLAAPDEARAMFRDPESENYIFNPAQSARAMAQYVQTDEIPFLTANTLFSMFTDQEKDLINSGVNAFKAQQAAAQAAYETAQQVYSNVLREFELTEQSRIQDEQMALEKDKFAFEKTKPRGGSTSKNQITVDVDGDKVLYDLDTQSIVTDAQGNPVVIERAKPETPELIQTDNGIYEYTPSAGLKPVNAPQGSNDPWYKGLQDFWGNLF